MNFKQIKLIFIATFICIDLFLLSVLVNRMPQSTLHPSLNVAQEFKRQNIAYQDDALDTKQITVAYVTAPVKKQEWAQAIDRLSSVEAKYDTEKHVLTATFRNRVPLALTDGVLSEANQSVIQSILDNPEYVMNGKEYVYVQYMPNRREIVYAQKVNGYPMMDSNASLTFLIDGTDVVGYTQSYLPTVSLEDQTRPLVSKKEAVINAYLSSLIPEEQTISAIKLGYQKTRTIDDFTLFSPIWHITLTDENSQETYLKIDALTNVPLVNVEEKS